MDCVAEVVYHEAQGEGEIGMRAVAHVIYNRAEQRGITPCQVVRQPFQFARGGYIANNSAWRMAQRVSENPGRDITNGATYFHNLSVRPRWSYNMTVTFRFGNHIFYRS